MSTEVVNSEAACCAGLTRVSLPSLAGKLSKARSWSFGGGLPVKTGMNLVRNFFQRFQQVAYVWNHARAFADRPKCKGCVSSMRLNLLDVCQIGCP